MNKKIFIVKGHEDGIIGVASNKKAAYRIASEYVCGADGEDNKNLMLSYSQVNKELNENRFCDVTDCQARFGGADIREEWLVSK